MNKYKATKHFFVLLMIGAVCVLMTNVSYAQNQPRSAALEEKQIRQLDEYQKIDSALGKETAVYPTIKDRRPDQIIKTQDVTGGTVRVERFVISGVTIFEPEDLVGLLVPYKGRDVSLGELNNIALKVQNFYRAKGYITTFVYVPVQHISNNTVEIRVVEGRIGKIEVEGARYFNKEFIRDKLQIREGDVILHKDLNKKIVNLNQNPDRTVEAVLVPGDMLETTDIVLKVKDRIPWHMFLEYNNFGSKYTGESRMEVGVSNNNLFGRDDSLSLRGQMSNGDLYTRSAGGLMGGSASYNIPINFKGTRLGAYISYLETEIGKEFYLLDSKGKALTGGAFVTHPIIDSEHVRSNLMLGFDIKRNKNYLLDFISSHDRLSVAKGGLMFDVDDKFGRTYLNNEIHFGIPHFAGSMDAIDPDASRLGGGGKFIKYVGRFSRRQNLPYSSYLMMSCKGQYTQDSLVSGEQFYVGGVDTVRGFPELSYTGDYGYALNAELRTPAFLLPETVKIGNKAIPIRDAVQLVGFLGFWSGFCRRSFSRGRG